VSEALEGHRPVTGNVLRAAVLGANDGLVSNLNLVMGVAGAGMPPRAILVTGLAGLVAGAISMALGEWVSVQSARELAKRELAVEARQLAERPEREEAELVVMFRAKGFDEAEARDLAARWMARPAAVLDTMAREELGFDPKDLGGSAWEAAGSSFVLFAIGALVPVLPFAFLAGRAAIGASLGLSAIGLLALGAAIGWLNGLGVAFAAFRQLLFGLAAAAATYAVGALVGVALPG
jgi:VIT1/CCC1 family predicted Fe2+/Mn2+ transporter